MKKFSKILVGILALSVLISCLTVAPAMAATTDPNAYVYVPIVTGEAATELFLNSTDDAGTDADFWYDDEYEEIVIEYPEGIENEDGTIERKRTELNLDLTPVTNYRNKYISFDITFDSLMDLVITPEPYNVSADLDNRPHSLYFTQSGYMAPTQHARFYKYETVGDTTGYQSNITGSWWIKDAKITQPYETYAPINVKFVITSTTGNTTAMSNGVKRLEYDEVQVYINGVRKGQLNSANRLDSWTNDFLHFAHYSTRDVGDTIYLKNLEIGYCEKGGRDEINILDHNDPDKTWEFPEGDNTFISITVPTTEEYAYHITSSIGDGGSTFQWFRNMGILNNWGTGFFDANGNCTQKYSSVESWKNVHTWQNSPKEVTVTYEINKIFGLVELYDSLGHWRKAYRSIPTSVSIKDIIGDVKPTKVVSGSFAGKGSKLMTNSNAIAYSFNSQTGQISMSEFGVTGKNKDLIAMYAWYDANGVLIDADTMSLKSDSTGVYTLAPARKFGSVAPAGASTLRTYLWDGTSFAPIRTSNLIQGSLTDLTSTRILGRTEWANNGFSLNWPGSGIEFTFDGTDAKVYCVKDADANGGNSYFTPYIDGVAQDRIIINQGWNTIASGLEDTTHTIKLVRSSEARDGRVWLSLVSANEVAPTQPKSRMIEFYGDSYSAGYGNMGVIPGSSVTWGDDENSDAQKAFPALVADYFNADSNVIAFSGKGLIKNGAKNEGLTIPQLAQYSDITVNGDSMTHTNWDYTKRAADLVVIFLGTNDAGNADATSEDFEAAYVEFIKSIRAKYSDAQILCIAKPSEDGCFGDEAESAVATVNNEGDDMVSFYRLSTWKASGIYAHPNIAESAEIAAELTEEISTLMGW